MGTENGDRAFGTGAIEVTAGDLEGGIGQVHGTNGHDIALTEGRVAAGGGLVDVEQGRTEDIQGERGAVATNADDLVVELHALAAVHTGGAIAEEQTKLAAEQVNHGSAASTAAETGGGVVEVDAAGRVVTEEVGATGVSIHSGLRGRSGKTVDGHRADTAFQELEIPGKHPVERGGDGRNHGKGRGGAAAVGDGASNGRGGHGAVIGADGFDGDAVAVEVESGTSVEIQLAVHAAEDAGPAETKGAALHGNVAHDGIVAGKSQAAGAELGEGIGGDVAGNDGIFPRLHKDECLTRNARAGSHTRGRIENEIAGNGIGPVEEDTAGLDVVDGSDREGSPGNVRRRAEGIDTVEPDEGLGRADGSNRSGGETRKGSVGGTRIGSKTGRGILKEETGTGGVGAKQVSREDPVVEGRGAGEATVHQVGGDETGGIGGAGGSEGGGPFGLDHQGSLILTDEVVGVEFDAETGAAAEAESRAATVVVVGGAEVIGKKNVGRGIERADRAAHHLDVGGFGGGCGAVRPRGAGAELEDPIVDRDPAPGVVRRCDERAGTGLESVVEFRPLGDRARGGEGVAGGHVDAASEAGVGVVIEYKSAGGGSREIETHRAAGVTGRVVGAADGDIAANRVVPRGG